MIKFAVKSLVVLVLVGSAIKLVEPADGAGTPGPRLVPAGYSEGPAFASSEREVVEQLSTLSNTQIVVSHAARDARGFCAREPLACESGRELLIRMATAVRDVAGSVAYWAGNEEEAPDMLQDDQETVYRPLENYRGTYPLLPAEPPARRVAF